MYKTEHSAFILSPLTDILKDGFSACQAAGDGIETFPLCEYVMQSIFLKLTGAQEQKLKCICWDMATYDYEYRYDYLNNKNYGECSNYKSKNSIFNDLISVIQKGNEAFDPVSYLKGILATATLNELSHIYDNSIMSIWLNKEHKLYKDNFSSTVSAPKIGQPNPKKPKSCILFASDLQALYDNVVYSHRNRCAHNTLSYQINKPDLNVLAGANYKYNNYFFRYSIILIIDKIFISLYSKYLDILANN